MKPFASGVVYKPEDLVSLAPTVPPNYDPRTDIRQTPVLLREVPPDPTSPAAVRLQMEKILVSPGFARSKRLGRFLRFTVDQYLDGRQNALKEYLVGVEVFNKLESFDPRVDSIVRVEARRLRSKLDRYYEVDGHNDATIIHFRKGSYVPVIMGREQFGRERALQSGFLPAAKHKKLIGIAAFTYFGMNVVHRDFCAGLSEDLITALTKLPGLRVVARKQSPLNGGDDSAPDYLLEGSFRETSGRLRICVQLIDTQAAVYFWSETFERELTDAFRVCDEICRAVTGALQTRLGEDRITA
ncbi:MAG TPA: hypothetical protein VMZ52_20070 [Bryobacteraceae bacterium]|nr:hypothetical protein [Bryobacteraceae bacterium]